MSSTPTRPGGALWAFATAFYGRPGIEAALLGLQDEDGVDVPILIALLYAGLQGLALAPEQLGALLDTALTWQAKAIAPLRVARRALKSAAGDTPDTERETLRAQVTSAELAAERLLINRLEALLPLAIATEPATAIQGNLKAYLASLPQPLSESGRMRLALLVTDAEASGDSWSGIHRN